MSILPTWPIAAGTLVIGLVAGAGITVSIKNGKIERIEAAHAEESRQRDAVRLADELAARQAEQQLQADVGRRLQEKENEKIRIAAERDALAISLRNRPDRPTARPGATTPVAAACPGATGAELYRADGEFLAGEAARADNLRAALGQCYAQYEAARAVINRPQAAPAGSTPQ